MVWLKKKPWEEGSAAEKTGIRGVVSRLGKGPLHECTKCISKRPCLLQPGLSFPAAFVPRSIIVTPGGRARLFRALFKAPPPSGGACGPDRDEEEGLHQDQGKLTRGLMPLSSCVAPARTHQAVYVSLPVNSPPPPSASHKSSLLGVCLGTSARTGKEWGRGGEARGTWRPRSGSGWRSGERRAAGICALRRVSARVGCVSAWVRAWCVWMPLPSWI